MDSAHSASGVRRRGAPPAGQRLTRDAVITRAGQMIAQHGLAAFSLRGLADALGVAPNALYNHIHNREDLLDAVTDQFTERIRFPADDQPWPDWVRTAAVMLRSQLTENPGVTELMLARAGSTATGPSVLTGFLDRLETAGLDRAVAHLVWHALLTVVVGSLWQERAREADREATFQAVLDVTMTGLLAVAERPPSPQAIALLHAHDLAGD
jgi:TetR/AcrR family transcriptional regulator, tetracycline repressor protein